MNSEKAPQEQSTGAISARDALAFETVQATLVAENWFFETIRTELRKVGPLADFPTISSPNGTDYLLHLTRFLFFLKALNCTDAQSIANFIDLHNEKISDDMENPKVSRSASEMKKAIMRPERRRKIVETVHAFGRPVFAIYDFGHFLIDTMSPKTTEKLIEDLRYGGLLERRIDQRIDADQKRVLIDSPGLLEDTYSQSLILQRRLLAQSMDEAEYEAARENADD